jgi:hypothetical protein
MSTEADYFRKMTGSCGPSDGAGKRPPDGFSKVLTCRRLIDLGLFEDRERIDGTVDRVLEVIS